MQTSLLDFKVTVPLFGTGSPFLSLRTPSERPERWTEAEDLGRGLPVRFSLSSASRLVNRIRKREFARVEWAKLAWMDFLAEDEGPGALKTVKYLQDQWRRVGVIPYPHQLETARRVIEEFGGRAILADEVGLGKTVEAGLILREYILRGQVERALILCPASLVWQWYHELREKFLISALLQRTEYDWERTDIIIASIDTAKRRPHADIIHSQEYDMLIVDEAHRLKNERTENYRFASKIRKTFCLMLTATPVQNDLQELYNLVHLTVPGLLGSPSSFRTRFMLDKRTPLDPDGLRRLLRRVLIRNRRGPDTVQLTARRVESVHCRLMPAERELYDELVNLSRCGAVGDGDGPLSALSLITLQREACSSAHALLFTLQGILERSSDPEVRARLERIAEKARAVNEHAKVYAVLDLLERIADRVIIFTEYRATQQYLLEVLQQRGITALGFDGSLSASRKEWTKELFRRYAQVLVSTESGGEGLNFQFCAHMINYDLPWNPMKVEQRIGRIHRLGQTRDVYVYNLVTADTIEEYIVRLLYEKIRLFELAVGELDEILSAASLAPPDLERELAEILSTSRSPGEMSARLEELAARIDGGRKARGRRPRLSIDALLQG